MRTLVLWTLGFVLVATSAVAEDTPTKPSVVVVGTKARGGANLRGPVRRLLERPMKRQFKVIPLIKYKRAGRRVKIRGRKLNTSEGAQIAGSKAGATHVLIVTGTMRREKIGRRKKRVFYAQVNLVDVQTGDLTLTKEYPLKGRRLTRDMAAAMLEEIVSALTPDPPPPEPEPEIAEEPEPPLAPPSPEPVIEPIADASSESTTEPLPESEATDPVLALSDIPLESDSTNTDGEVAVIGAPTQELAPTIDAPPPPEAQISARYRSPFQLVAGATMIRRQALMTAREQTITPPCYCGDNSSAGPFFPGGWLAFDLYPLAFGGTGSLIEGLGLHGETMLTRVKTRIDDGSTITSNYVSIRAGLHYRFVFWKSKTAPDIRLDVGATYLHFPIRRASFPGVKYYGYPNVGLAFNIPLMTESVALMGSFSYSPIINVQGKAGNLLGTQRKIPNGGSSIFGEGGLRIRVGIIEGRILTRYEQTDVRFKGTSSLPGVAPLTNPRISDRILSIHAGIGVAL